MAEDRNPETRAPSRELKVKVPLAVHIQLHSVKILTGKRISDVVTDALARYFASGENDAAYAPAASRPPGLAVPADAAGHRHACDCVPSKREP